MPTILVTGANRGLGLEFVRQYADDGWTVFACCRAPADASELRGIAARSFGRVRTLTLDVKDHLAIERTAEELKGVPIDILLNNAGIYGPNRVTLGSIDYALWQEVLAVNVLAPIRMAECFLENVAVSDRKILAAVSSTMGSIAKNLEGRHYLYRSSKAALNMAWKSLAVDVKPRGIAAVVFCPGWVRTDMGGANAPLSPAESIGGMKRVLESLSLKDSGRFLSHRGDDIPW